MNAEGGKFQTKWNAECECLRRNHQAIYILFCEISMHPANIHFSMYLKKKIVFIEALFYCLGVK